MQLENKMLFKIIIYTCPIIRSYLTLCDPMDCSPPLSMGFPRQDYWSGLSFPPPGYLPHPCMEPMTPAMAGRLFTTEPPVKPHTNSYSFLKYKVE